MDGFSILVFCFNSSYFSKNKKKKRCLKTRDVKSFKEFVNNSHALTSVEADLVTWKMLVLESSKTIFSLSISVICAG